MSSIKITKTLVEYFEFIKNTGTVLRIWLKNVNENDECFKLFIDRILTDSKGDLIGFTCDILENEKNLELDYKEFIHWNDVSGFAISSKDQLFDYMEEIKEV
jgi:hypothetical protein